MSLFLESIALKDRAFLHLSWHNNRVEQTLRAQKGLISIDLASSLSIPDELDNRLYKCRVLYDDSIRQVEFIPYSRKSIQSLQVIDGQGIEYSHKYADRSQLQQLLAQKGACDDILILREGKITDTSYCNIAFWNGARWLTPASPLLPGTCRARLLSEGIIQEADIHIEDLFHFSSARLMNAMIGWSQESDLSIDHIHLLSEE